MVWVIFGLFGLVVVLALVRALLMRPASRNRRNGTDPLRSDIYLPDAGHTGPGQPGGHHHGSHGPGGHTGHGGFSGGHGGHSGGFSGGGGHH